MAVAATLRLGHQTPQLNSMWNLGSLESVTCVLFIEEKSYNIIYRRYRVWTRLFWVEGQYATTQPTPSTYKAHAVNVYLLVSWEIHQKLGFRNFCDVTRVCLTFSSYMLWVARNILVFNYIMLRTKEQFSAAELDNDAAISIVIQRNVARLVLGLTLKTIILKNQLYLCNLFPR